MRIERELGYLPTMGTDKNLGDTANPYVRMFETDVKDMAFFDTLPSFVDFSSTWSGAFGDLFAHSETKQRFLDCSLNMMRSAFADGDLTRIAEQHYICTSFKGVGGRGVSL